MKVEKWLVVAVPNKQVMDDHDPNGWGDKIGNHPNGGVVVMIMKQVSEHKTRT